MIVGARIDRATSERVSERARQLGFKNKSQYYRALLEKDLAGSQLVKENTSSNLAFERPEEKLIVKGSFRK